MPLIVGRRWFFPVVFLAIIALGIFLRTRHFNDEIAGHHCFRQAHVASNIQFLVTNGLGLKTKHFNKWRTRTIYDGPLYQNTVASLCLATGLPVITASRIINIAVYVSTCLMLLALMTNTGISIRTSAIVIFLYALSPLSVYYDRAVIPDNLAVLLSLVALVSYLRWHAAVNVPKGKRILWWTMMTVAGAASAFIKPPVMFPVMLVIASHWCFSTPRRSLLNGALFAFGGIILATVIGFTFFSNQVNYGTNETPASDWTWYFSDLTGRMHLESYQNLLVRLYEVLAVPPVFSFAVLGFALALLIRSPRIHIIYRVWPVAALVTALLFFNVHRLHDYYQIPFVFILCFHAGYFLEWFDRQLRQMAGATVGVNRFARACIPLALVVFVGAVYQLHHLPFIVDEQARHAGRFIRDNSPSDAFVVYMVPDAHQRPNEYWLWLAQREGYNLNVDEFSIAAISDVTRTHIEGVRPAFLFVPSTLQARVDEHAIQSQLQIAAQTDDGKLYSLILPMHSVE